MRTSTSKRVGFTLVELLVVIGIIALLISILLPVLGKVQRQSRKVACMSNLRQMGMVFQLYSGDFKGKSIPYRDAAEVFWMQLLRPYYRNIDALRFCPMVESQSTGWGTSISSWRFGIGSNLNINNLSYFQGSYGVNGWLYERAGGSQYSGGTIQDYIKLPSRRTEDIPMWMDCTWVDAWPRDYDPLPPDLIKGDPARQGNAPNENMMGRCVIARHDKAINICFLDGHTETVPLGRLYKLKWSNKFVPKDVAIE